jgi:hypothetical protein
VQDRDASLAIIPAGSIAVVAWLVAAAALFGVTLVEKRLTSPRGASPGEQTQKATETA